MPIVLLTPDEANLFIRYLEVLYMDREVTMFINELNILTGDDIKHSYAKGLIAEMHNMDIINTDSKSYSLTQAHESLLIIQFMMIDLKQEMEEGGYNTNLSDCELLTIDCNGDIMLKRWKQRDDPNRIDIHLSVLLDQSILCDMFKCPVDDPNYVDFIGRSSNTPGRMSVT